MKLLHKSLNKNNKQSFCKQPLSGKLQIVSSITILSSPLLSSPMSIMNSGKPYILGLNLFDQSLLLINTKLEANKGNFLSIRSMGSKEVIVLTYLRPMNYFQTSTGFILHASIVRAFLQHKYQKNKGAFAKEKLL